MSAWGGIIAVLLSLALGVAVVVWRRAVLHAYAVLETSPLGLPVSIQEPWIDGRRLACTVVLFEGLAFLCVFVLGMQGRLLMGREVLGIIGSAGLCSFVVYLLGSASRRDRVAGGNASSFDRIEGLQGS